MIPKRSHPEKYRIYPAQPNIQQTTPRGVLPYMTGLGMCRCGERYGFQAVYSGVRNNNNSLFSTTVDRYKEFTRNIIINKEYIYIYTVVGHPK